MMRTITIEIPEGKRAEWVDGVLTLVDEQPKDITERIKTFEDARIWCESNGQHDICRAYYAFQTELISDEACNNDILAYLKLRIITCALNEGWKPTFEEGEMRWFVEYNNPTSMFSRNWLSYPTALFLKSEQLVEYAATQFCDIYMDFCKGKE